MGAIRNSLYLQDRMTPTLRSILRAMDSVMTVMKDLDKTANNGVQSRAYKQAEASIKTANNQLILMRNNSIMAASGADSVADAWDNVNNSVNKAKSGFGSFLSSSAGGIYTLKSGLQSVQKLLNMSDSATSDIAKLSLFNTSGSSNIQAYGEVYKTAQESRSSLSGTSSLAQRIMLSGVYEGQGSTKSAIDLAGTINKAMVLGGGTSEENDRAILQLSQGLSSGVLQGDELRSIREQAPYLAKVLAEGLANVDDKFVGTTIGDLKELGAQGELTSKVVVEALQSMSGQINESFEDKAPKTFSGALQSISNTMQFFTSVLSTSEGPLGRINQALWNFADYLSTPQGFEAMSAILPVFNAVAWAAEMVSAAIVGIGNNMSWIAPILGGILTMILLYNGYMLVSKAITLATGFAQGIAAVAAYARAKAENAAALSAAEGTAAGTTLAATLTAEAMAASSATAAQHGLNAALWACPITWIIIAIIAVIAIIFIVVAIINDVTGSSVSAIGIIVGAITWLASVIWNIIVGVINAVIQFVWTYFVQPWIGIIEFIINAFNGGFSSFEDAVANLIGNIIGWFLSLGQVVTNIIDAIFGTNWTAGLESLKGEVISWGKTEEAITISREAPSLEDIGINRWDSTDAWDAGYNWGAGIEESLGNFGNMDDLLSGLDTSETTVSGGHLDSVDSIDSDVSISDEDVQLLRDMAARDYLLQLQSITPVAHVTFGDVRETADVHKIVEVIEQMVEEQMSTSLVS